MSLTWKPFQNVLVDLHAVCSMLAALPEPPRDLGVVTSQDITYINI